MATPAYFDVTLAEEGKEVPSGMVSPTPSQQSSPSQLPSTSYKQWSTVYQLPSTLYQQPSTSAWHEMQTNLASLISKVQKSDECNYKYVWGNFITVIILEIHADLFDELSTIKVR